MTAEQLEAHESLDDHLSGALYRANDPLSTPAKRRAAARNAAQAMREFAEAMPPGDPVRDSLLKTARLIELLCEAL